MADEEQKAARVDYFSALSSEASHCTACPLASTRTKVVFGVGNPNSPLMLIGEGPGASEDALGEPFVGRAGKLLDECLHEAGMHRKHLYITNIVKCRASAIVDGRIKNRVPTADEISTCVPLWLTKQIREMNPLVIVCIGGPAASTVIRKDFKISKERGKFLESPYCSRTIAALHPAFVLRQEGAEYARTRQLIIDDLTAAKERAIQAKHEPASTLF